MKIKKSAKYENYFKNYLLYFPFQGEHIIEWWPSGNYQITIQFDNGELFFYNNLTGYSGPVKRFDEVSEITLGEWKMRFAQRFMRALEEHNLTQRMLSERTGITESNLSLYSNGRAVPSAMTISKLAKAIGCSADDLLPL